MTVTGNDPYIATYNEARWNLAPAVVGQTWTASVWAKGTTATSTAQLFMMASASSGGFLDANAVTVVVGTSWQRVTASYTLVSTSTAFVQVRLDGPDSAGTGTNIWWDGLQVERNASATAFSPLTNVNGTQWKDLSGQINNAVLSGNPSTTATTGAVILNGSNQYATVSNNIVSPSAYTKCIWLNCSSFGSSNNMLSNTPGTIFWLAGTNRITGADTSNANFSIAQSSISLNLNTWYHAALTYNNSGVTTSTWKIYVNGVLDTTTIAATSPPLSGIQVGAFGSGNLFNGQLALPMIYNRVLSDAEINQNFQAQRTRFGI
jgi:hypothetical protein